MDNTDIKIMSNILTKQLMLALDEELTLIQMCEHHENEDHQLEIARYKYYDLLSMYANKIQKGICEILEGSLDHDDFIESLNDMLKKYDMKGGEK